MIIKATYALTPLNVGNWLLHVGYSPFPLIFLNVSAFTVCSTSWTWQDFAESRACSWGTEQTIITALYQAGKFKRQFVLRDCEMVNFVMKKAILRLPLDIGLHVP